MHVILAGPEDHYSLRARIISVHNSSSFDMGKWKNKPYERSNTAIALIKNIYVTLSISVIFPQFDSLRIPILNELAALLCELSQDALIMAECLALYYGK